MRQVLCPLIAGQRIVMTRHGPESDPASGSVSPPPALVLFNGGQVPRDGHAGLAVRLADVAAERGIPAYRVDLPGLGDSPEDVLIPLPKRTDVFWHENEIGLQSDWAAAVLDFIKSRLGHPRLIVGGLCGAATNALLCFMRSPDLVDAMVLIEPQLFFTPVAPAACGQEDNSSARIHRPNSASRDGTHRSGATSNTPNSRKPGPKKAARQPPWREALAIPRAFLRTNPRLRRALLRFMPKRILLRGRTNLRLAEAYAGACAARVPILCILESGGPRARHLERVEQALLPFRARKHLLKIELPHTNHVLTEGNGVGRCTDALRSWLTTAI